MTFGPRPLTNPSCCLGFLRKWLLKQNHSELECVGAVVELETNEEMLRVPFRGATEQIVGRERRERVSQLAWCGEGCFDARRRVNSDVMRLPIPMNRILLTGALVLFAVPSSAQQKDVLGWEDSRWGMSERNLITAFGSRLTKLSEPMSFLDLHADYIVAALEIQGQRFTVFFQMDNRTNRLSQVLVRLNEMEARLPREELFSKLDSQLTQQYGPATSRSDERDFKSTIKSVCLNRTWKFSTTTVELYYGWDSQINASLLTIRYFPTDVARINERRITNRWTRAESAGLSSTSCP